MSGGLGNVGNTCYLNTTLQCLGNCPEFLKYILQDSHNDSNNMASYLHEIYKELWVHKHSIIPNRLLRYLKDTIKSMNLFEQNDINEFLSVLIDKLNQHVSKPIKITKKDLITRYNYSTSEYDVQRLKMDASWYEKTGKEYSPLVPMFNGQTISQIVCGACDKIFHNYEIYLNLMLPVTDHTNTIYDCFDEYFKDEEINNDHAIWTCDTCHQKHVSNKSTKLWRNPKILIVSLKRFTPELKKNNKRIDIPEELDISNYSLTKKSIKYTLRAVAHHSGSFDSGHYHAVCKNQDDKWIDYDDLNVREVQAPSHTHGYVFFYCLNVA